MVTWLAVLKMTATYIDLWCSPELPFDRSMIHYRSFFNYAYYARALGSGVTQLENKIGDIKACFDFLIIKKLKLKDRNQVSERVALELPKKT